MTMPSPSQWSKEKIEQVSVTPWSMHERQVPEITHREAEPAVETQEKESQIRKFYIKQSDLDAYGYTQHCPRYDRILAYGPGSATMPHSLACRARIEAAVAGTAQGQQRLQRVREREDRYLAEQVQQGDHRDVDVAQGENAAGPHADLHDGPPRLDDRQQAQQATPTITNSARRLTSPTQPSAGWRR